MRKWLIDSWQFIFYRTINWLIIQSVLLYCNLCLFWSHNYLLWNLVMQRNQNNANLGIFKYLITYGYAAFLYLEALCLICRIHVLWVKSHCDSSSPVGSPLVFKCSRLAGQACEIVGREYGTIASSLCICQWWPIQSQWVSHHIKKQRDASRAAQYIGLASILQCAHVQ